MYYKSIMKRQIDANSKTHAHTRPSLRHLSPSGMLPGPTRLTCFSYSRTWLPTGTRRATLGNRHLNFISYWIQWKHIHHLRKLEAFFQDLFGCNWISLQNEEVCTDRKQDTLKKRMVPTWGVCEITLTDGDEMLAACLCPLILASDNSHPPWHWLFTASVTFLGLHSPLPPKAHKQQLQTQSFSLGSNLQNRVFLHLK